MKEHCSHTLSRPNSAVLTLNAHSEMVAGQGFNGPGICCCERRDDAVHGKYVSIGK